MQQNLNWENSDREVSLQSISSSRNFPSSYNVHVLHNRTMKRQKGYVMALTYSGQQGAGIQALLSLQCWATSFNLPVAILEPIMSGTAFTSFPQHDNDSFIRFGDFFDIDHFNKVSESIGYHIPIGTREHFSMNAPRQVILVHVKMVPKNTSLIERSPKVVWSADTAKNNCYQDSDLTLQLGPLEKEKFCIIRVIKGCFSLVNHYIFSDKDVHQVIFGNRSPEDITLIFSFWRTPWYVENSRLDNPKMCKGAGIRSSKEQFIPSPRLVADSMRYEREFLSSSNEIALMLRIEHMIEFVNQDSHSAQNVWTVDSCLLEALRITKGYLNSGLPMVTLDLGKFGSKFWNFLTRTRGVDVDALTEKSKLLLETLFDGKLTFEEWEESFTKAARGVEHSGYIAALQRTLASRAKCLVLVGGGSFQDLALKDYLRKHPNKEDQCVHHVCFKNERNSITNK